MHIPISPLFPTSSLALSPTRSLDATGMSHSSALLPPLPDKPLCSSGSVQLFIIPTEKTLFLQGFESQEYSERPPALLRGCLFLRILKPTKIKSISLTFKGQQRTDWPEGIPPKRSTYAEMNDIISHTWPFYNSDTPSTNCGADFYQELCKSHQPNDLDVTHLSLADSISRPVSPVPQEGNFFTRTLSPTNFMKRAVSPVAGESASFSDLNSILSFDLDSKTGNFAPGDYVYNFEHPLHPSIPETTSATFGEVSYSLRASIVRPGTFKSNLSARLPIDIVRVPSEQNLEENEPIVISRDWEDQLKYDIVIGGKSVVLNSYLPLAFRFVPLWGKVALHRIRVYLSEDLEYFCQDKKVHRSEPQKKFLLLEYKALKGRSILSKSGGQVANVTDDDEVLPRELEFQLYIPSEITGKASYKINPDTSFQNIQSHHWLKICLRISKPDPENPEKKKHFEISIDSPIHILSPLAAHGNTLLPVYDDSNQGIGNLPIYTPSTPPLSPGVMAIQGERFVFGENGPGNGSENSSSLDEIIRLPSPIDFHHINTHNDPIERSANMHLEANLFKPSSKDSNSHLKSPQAVAHPDTFSPLNSPIQRPIHLIRRPSFNPPTFEASMQTIDATLPPAYEPHDPSPARSGINTSTEESSENIAANHSISSDTAEPSSSFCNLEADSTLQKQSLEEANLADDKHRQYEEDEEDIADIPGSPIHLPTEIPINSALAQISRRSSISSTSSSSSNMPIEQTLPLLSSSTSSLITSSNTHQYKSRNSSINSFVADRRFSNSNGNSTNITDIVDYDYSTAGANKIHGSLLHLRNPRIKKHYQDENAIEEFISSNEHEEDISSRLADNNGVCTPKLRQKSFGVISTPDDSFSNRSTLTKASTSFETNSYNSSKTSSSQSETMVDPQIPQFKYSYIVD